MSGICNAGPRDPVCIDGGAMVDVALSLGRLLVAFFLVFLNGFFVAAEFAFVRIRATAVEQLAAEGRRGSGVLTEVMANLDDYLATTQLGITIASLGLGWVGEPAVAALIEPALGSILPESGVSLVAFALGFGFITFLHVVFGELAPKTIAIQRAERLSLLIAPPMKLFYYLFLPGILVFNGTANAFTQLIGIPPASESEEAIQEDELRMLLARSGSHGEIAETEVEMIDRVFELDDTIVREVMVPRPNVVAIPADASLDQIHDIIQEAEHTRYPVVAADEPDHIEGYLDVKDILTATFSDDHSTMTAADVARDVLIIPESARINELLRQFRDEQLQMAAVIDEWGALEGIATVEDVVETIVGDLRDDFDTPASTPTIEALTDGRYRIGGGVPIHEVNQRLDASFESDTFETIAGLFLDRLGRAPTVGDRIEIDTYTLEITDVDGARITAIQAWQPDDTA